MDKFLEIFGGLIVVLVLLAAIAVVVSARDSAVTVAIAAWAIPGLVGGVVIAAFGAMLGHLKGIHYHAAKQTGILEQLEFKTSNHQRAQAILQERQYAPPARARVELSNVTTRFSDK